MAAILIKTALNNTGDAPLPKVEGIQAPRLTIGEITNIIKACIAVNSADPRGVSRPVIKKYIQLNLKIDITPGFAKDIGKAIKDGHEKGIFELPSGLNGKVRLAPKPVKPTPKQPVPSVSTNRAPLVLKSNNKQVEAADAKRLGLKLKGDVDLVKKSAPFSPARKVGAKANKENINPRLHQLVVKLEAKNSPLRPRNGVVDVKPVKPLQIPAKVTARKLSEGSPLRQHSKPKPYRPKEDTVSVLVNKPVKSTKPSFQLYEGYVTGVPGDEWVLTRRLGRGAFGEVWLAKGIGKNKSKRMAIKTEWRQADLPLLPMESMVLDSLAGLGGFPSKKIFCSSHGWQMLGMEELGENTESRLTRRGRMQSMDYIINYAIQMLHRLKAFHGTGWLHRDFKPDNVLHHPTEPNTLYLVDFGFAKRYRHPITGAHIPPRNGKGPLGTPRYASLNIHLGREASRRDDLESLGYTLVYLTKGRLPWQGLPAGQDGWEGTYQAKARVPVLELCQWMPSEFANFLNYCRTLGFDEEPDYGRWARSFELLKNRLFPPVPQFQWGVAHPIGNAVRA